MERLRFCKRALLKGLPTLWRVVGLVALVLGTSVLAYALNRPLVAGIILAGAVAFTLGEGAYQLYAEAQRRHAAAEREVAKYENQQPRLSFGRAEIPPRFRLYDLRVGDGYPRRIGGRVIRVPVLNAPGAGDARRLSAVVTFMPDDPHRSFAPKYPAQGEWEAEDSPQVEVDLPAGSRRYLNVVIVLDFEYPHAFEWTNRSRETGLNGYGIEAGEFDVEIEVTGSGYAAAQLRDTLRIYPKYRHMIRADWRSAGPDEATNWVEW